MSMMLKNVRDIDALRTAIAKCEDDVLLKSCDGRETFNMKSTLSQYVAIGELLKDHGDTYEFFCMNKRDEAHLMEFFKELKEIV